MYKLDDDGIYIPIKQIVHRNNEYHDYGFNTLLDMQSKHFWYIGRHKFILETLKRHQTQEKFSVIDLGGGCGGWIDYLEKNLSNQLIRIALADSSRVALLNAKKVISPNIKVYQADLMALDWHEKLDVAFLLDVIEHCPDDLNIVKQASKTLKSGGKLIVTAPALDFFWSYNDECAKHLRRYTNKQFQKLAFDANLKLIDSRYFMFFLSPLLWLSRKTKSKNLSEKDLLKAMKKEHKVPPLLVNKILAAIFKAETPIGQIFRFPWGTSIIGVFQKE